MQKRVERAEKAEEKLEAKLKEWDRVFGTDTVREAVKYAQESVRAPRLEPCPGCNGVLNRPYESGRWRIWPASTFRKGPSTIYQHEDQDGWIMCPGQASAALALEGGGSK